jgi:hypothetical protein
MVTCLAYSSILKMEAVCSSEMSIYVYRTTQRYIPEDSILHSHHPKNLKPIISSPSSLHIMESGDSDIKTHNKCPYMKLKFIFGRFVHKPALKEALFVSYINIIHYSEVTKCVRCPWRINALTWTLWVRMHSHWITVQQMWRLLRENNPSLVEEKASFSST